MNFAKIEDGICVNVAVFDDAQTATELGYPLEVPPGYWIGDCYDGDTWTNAPPPEPEPAPKPDEAAQVAALARVLAMQAAPGLSDAQALAMPDLFPDWEDVLHAGEPLGKDAVIRRDGVLYRVVQEGTIPQAHQAPGGDGMLAVYRPIDQTHAGTQNDPIPWVHGMDCYQDTYYSHGGKTYLCKADMLPCTWAPDTAGVWQWEESQSVAPFAYAAWR